VDGLDSRASSSGGFSPRGLRLLLRLRFFSVMGVTIL
jgi:hypothetical protein